MAQFKAFFKKELREQFKTPKFLIIGIVSLVVMLLSVVFAKILPILFELAGLTESGINITSTYMDTYNQYFSSMSEIGLIVLIIIYAGSLSSEISKGTMVTLLANGMSRPTIILVKFLVQVIVWTICYWASFGLNILGTLILFGEATAPYLGYAGLMLYLYGNFTIALMIFGGALTRKYGLTLLIALGFFLVGTLISVIPNVAQYLPTYLSLSGYGVMQSAISIKETIFSLCLTIGLTGVLVYLATICFKKATI